jgi:hypothetical protein
MENMRLRQISFIALALIAFVGCAEKKDVAPTEPTTENVEEGAPIQTTTGSASAMPDTTGWGFPVPLTLNCSNFQEFSGRSCSNINFDNTKLFYNIDKVMVDGRAHYKGTLRLYYNYTQVTGGWGPDAGQSVTTHKSPKFESGSTTTDIKFNRYYTQNGKAYFVGFYEEKAWNPTTNTYSDFRNFGTTPPPFGSLMIVLDELSESGATGKLYYRNFRYEAFAGDKPQSNNLRYKCWNITEGPYSCREFVRNGTDTQWERMLETTNGMEVRYNSQYSNLEAPYFYKELGDIGAGSQGIVIPE